MVFATEFDPREQSQRRHPSQPSPQTSQTVPSHQPSSNVVPLKVSGPAKRVRLDSNLTLALPNQPKLPWGLRLLNRLQQGSAAATGVLVAGALIVYSSTVYIDKSTSQAITQLDELQGESQQLTSANEAIKQTLAEQATRADSGLEPYESGDVLFVPPALPREKLAVEVSPPQEMPGPLGY